MIKENTPKPSSNLQVRVRSFPAAAVRAEDFECVHSEKPLRRTTVAEDMPEMASSPATA